MTISRQTPSELVTLTLKKHQTTDKAYLLSEGNDRNRASWVAKSLVENYKVIDNHRDIVEIEIPEWLAKKCGWL